MIAVLLPSRGRPDSLVQSVESLTARAADRDDVIILVAADPDDEATQETAAALALPCYIAPERWGYSRLNYYFDRLAELARGCSWLMLWNDDARMLTTRWDQAIRTYSHDPTALVLDPWVDGHSPDLCTFPIVRGRAVRATGGFSPYTPHCDTWWQDIGRAIPQALVPVPIKIEHQRYDLTGQHNDQTRREALDGYRTADFYGETVQRHLREAVERIRSTT